MVGPTFFYRPTKVLKFDAPLPNTGRDARLACSPVLSATTLGRSGLASTDCDGELPRPSSPSPPASTIRDDGSSQCSNGSISSHKQLSGVHGGRTRGGDGTQHGGMPHRRAVFCGTPTSIFFLCGGKLSRLCVFSVHMRAQPPSPRVVVPTLHPPSALPRR